MVTIQSIMDRAEEPKRWSRSKYQPHQNLNEQARRLMQVQKGQLKGDLVSDGARMMAHGIVPAPVPTIIRAGRIDY